MADQEGRYKGNAVEDFDGNYLAGSSPATLGPSQPNPNLKLPAVGLTAGYSGGFEGPDGVFVLGIPHYFTELCVKELLETLGSLRRFIYVEGTKTRNSKGYAFCVYQDPDITGIACAVLNTRRIISTSITARRASEQEFVLAMQGCMLQPHAVATKIVCLTQFVYEDELKNDEEYEAIVEEIKLGGISSGVVNVVIPRPNPNGEPCPGVGKVFLEFGDTKASKKARAWINGREFRGNAVVAVFYPENKFALGEYDG